MSLFNDNDKYFTFEVRGKEHTVVEFSLPEDCAWTEIVPYFNQFLSGCGYIAKKYNTFVDEADYAD